MKLPPIGSDVKVVFLDHAEAAGGEHDERVQEFFAEGVLVSKTRKEIVVRSWGYSEDQHGESDCNTHQWVIVRSAIVALGVGKFTWQYKAK